MVHMTPDQIEIIRLREVIANERRIAELQIQLFATRLGPDDPLTLEVERRFERMTAALRG